MRYRKYIQLLLAAFVASRGIFIYAETASKLPTTEILGKEYYVYEVKKGESIYGIAKRYGWDLEELMLLNPKATGQLTKGQQLFYPTGQVAVVAEMPEAIEISAEEMQPIRHKVNKGETVYSISRQYNIPLDIIYKYNPGAKKGVKTGEILEMPQSPSAQYYFYTLKRGDTLTSLSKEFNTSAEDILRNNPGLTVENLKGGETIRISINSNLSNVKREMVAEEKVTSISTYKVKKDETWEEISEKTGVEVEVLKEANQGEKSGKGGKKKKGKKNEDNNETSPEENSIVTVPVIETVQVEKVVNPLDIPELSGEEINELYDSIKGISPGYEKVEGVRMALILDEPNSKKDIDFTRGVLVALSGMEKAPYKIDLKVMDGRVASTNLIDELDAYEPNLIVSTADKTFPIFLADYGNTNNIQIVNVFDLKNDLYEDNASMIQILPPSTYFNDRISNQIYKENPRRKLIFVGEKDENDGIASELTKLYESEPLTITLEEFGSYEPDLMESVLIYSYASKKEEAGDFLTNVETLAENSPGFNFKIVGRQSWISMFDEFEDIFKEYSVMIPTRVWLDESTKEWQKFEEEYERMFGGSPIRSIPNFAASGYDIASYFIPLVEENKGDFNRGSSGKAEKTLQSEIHLQRVNNWGGFINGAGYLLKFNSGGKTEKTAVK